jgi:hypothetical protein
MSTVFVSVALRLDGYMALDDVTIEHWNTPDALYSTAVIAMAVIPSWNLRFASWQPSSARRRRSCAPALSRPFSPTAS